MAELDFILQAVTTANHAKALQALLALPDPTEVLVSVAFVREPGLDALEAAIKPVAVKARFFIGIRNDITSIQAVKRLLAMKVKLYAVDTGSRGTLFHPKLYLAASGRKATAIIGSANLTFGGLHNNIEVSTRVNLDLSSAADKKFLEDVTNAFAEMLKNHPRHVFLIKDDQHAGELFSSGRLADENLTPAPSFTSSVRKGERDDLPPMKLNRVFRSGIAGAIPKPLAKPLKSGLTAVAQPASSANYLVWESKPLERRDLTIPTASGTHETGSVNLDKGLLPKAVDHRSYFRDEVFSHLVWTPRSKTVDEAHAKFQLIISGIGYGEFNLNIRHTKTKDKSYKQRNALTRLSWGPARQYIARPDLIGRTLALYCDAIDPTRFTIEID
ncbi:MAG: hypothetical protein ABR912_14170 [Terracidiphilus sp.]|jgi:HKD family nuclease